ncbi:MAG: sulfotransferase family protein [Nocardioides sp.]
MTEAFAGSELSSPAPQQAVFIVGSGRSGSSALACTLQILGMHVPAPEVPPDNTNPKGFGESQWVVDLHDRMLRRANVAVSDARPQAWFDTGKLSTNERLRETVKAWAEAQFSEDISEIVLKDPRLAWFIGLWRSAVLRSGVEPSYAVTLRPPAEVIASKQKYYSVRVSESSRAASWVNHMLHTERATRGSRRVFVRYHDLLDDWTVPIYRLGESFELEAVRTATAKELRRVHDFIDPDLRRVRGSSDDLDLPPALRTVVEETWQHLDQLVDGSGDTAESHSVLDEIRLEYTRIYEEAESLAESTTLAARRKRQAERRGVDAADPAVLPDEPLDAPVDEADPPPAGAPDLSPTSPAVERPEPRPEARKRGLLSRRSGS